jgi:hypothetical protein
MARRGTERWTILAVDRESGAIAGLTELFLPAHDTWLVEQGDTGVLAPHRGHGLGRWLKAATRCGCSTSVPTSRWSRRGTPARTRTCWPSTTPWASGAAAVEELVQGAIEPLLERLTGRR